MMTQEFMESCMIVYRGRGVKGLAKVLAEIGVPINVALAVVASCMETA